MKIRPKTIRRLLILAVGAVAISAAVGIAFTARRFARESQINEARALGMSAYASHDYSHALESLGKFILSRPNDVEALYALGCSRMAMETPNRDYLFEARLRFQQLLVIDPTHIPASLKLMEVYEKTNQSSEMLDLSGRVLKRSPDEPAAMRFHAIALTRLKKQPEARAAWATLVQLTPDDVNAQSQLLTAMRANGESSEDIIRYAEKLVADHSEDLRFKIPLATALRDAGKEAESLAVLKTLTSNPPSDPDAVLELVTMLDRAAAFDDAQRVLERAAQSLNSSMLSTALVQRVWQAGQPEQVVAITDKLIAAGRAQPTSLALRALSLSALDRRDEAAKLVSQLADGESAIERAWSDALSVEFSKTSLTPTQRVEAFSKALGRDPNNAMIYTWLARALLQMGEIDQAARCYRESAQRMPSWPTPCLELAQAMLNAGRTEDAIPAAKAAYLRSPAGAGTQVQLARVRFAALQQRFDLNEQKQLLKFVVKLREELPFEPSLLPIHVALLAREGAKADASALVVSTLGSKPTQSLIVALYQADRLYSLGQSDAILRYAQSASLTSPELLTAYATDLVTTGHAERAAELVKSLSQSATESPGAALAEARIRTLLGDVGAASAWRMAATRFPDNLALQMATLDEAIELIGDRSFHEQLIARVRSLTSEDGIYWRMEQAKFLSSSSNLDDARQAMTIASELLRQQPMRTDLRVLLGRVLTRLDSRTTALEHLRAAFDQTPTNPAIGMELVDAFVQLNRSSDAQAVLKRISALDIEDSGTRNRLARVLLENGMNDELIVMLERARDRQYLDRAGSLLLAETLWSAERTDAAAALYDALLADDPSPAALASAAAFQRESGHADLAAGLIARIPSASGTNASRHYAVARYHAKYGEIDAAREAFNRAVIDTTSDASMLRDAIAIECTARNFDQAKKLLDMGRRRFGSHPILDRAEAELAAMRSGDSHIAIEKLIDALSRNPSTKAEVEALRASLESRRSGTVTLDMASTLVQLANRYPAAFDLQKEAISACIAVNQSGPAVTIAHRLASMSSARADMQELSARTLAHFGQWNTAKKVAEHWKTLVANTPREPDLLLSAISMASGKASQSLQLSDPYVGSFDPKIDLASIATRASALMATGRSDECFDMLRPWIAGSVEVRLIWLQSAIESPVAQVDQRLQQLTSAIPIDSIQERVRIAAACLDVSERTENTQSAVLGLSLISTIADAAETTRILRAELLRACGEHSKAESELRNVLVQFPDSARAKNSLAYLLVSQSKALEESLKLATEAAAALPNKANILDTLARAMTSQGDFAGATSRFTEALKLDPEYMDALIGLARIRQRQGNAAEAQAIVARVDQILSSDARRFVPAHLRGELNSLRQSLSGTPD